MAIPQQSWSVFVPCFNEGNALIDVVERIIRVMDKIASEYEILIVDDGSTDNSKTVIGELVKTGKQVSAVYREANYGIGSVQRRAYTTARFENVIIISGDGQFDPDELIMNNTIAPRTWLSFYRRKHPSYTLFRKFLSRANKLMNRFLYRLELNDVNWTMAFKSDDLRKLDLRMQSTLLKSEACIKLNLLGYKVIEIPSVYHPRKSGKARGASYKIIRQAASETAKLYGEIQRFKKMNLNWQQETRSIS